MGLFGIDSTKQESTVNDQKVSLNAGGFGVSASNLSGAHVEYGDAEVAKKALDTALAQSNVSLESTYLNLVNTGRFQDNALHSVDAAVAAAQDIAKTAAPVSPGNYAESISGQNNKALILIAVIAGAVLIFRKKLV